MADIRYDQASEDDGIAGFGWSLLFACLTLFVFAAFQLSQVILDRTALQNAYDSQTAGLAQGDKVRELVKNTVEGLNNLARAGNANAATLLADMQKAGIMSPSGPAANAASAQPPVSPDAAPAAEGSAPASP